MLPACLPVTLMEGVSVRRKANVFTVALGQRMVTKQ